MVRSVPMTSPHMKFAIPVINEFDKIITKIEIPVINANQTDDFKVQSNQLDKDKLELIEGPSEYTIDEEPIDLDEEPLYCTFCGCNMGFHNLRQYCMGEYCPKMFE